MFQPEPVCPPGPTTAGWCSGGPTERTRHYAQGQGGTRDSPERSRGSRTWGPLGRGPPRRTACAVPLRRCPTRRSRSEHTRRYRSRWAAGAPVERAGRAVACSWSAVGPASTQFSPPRARERAGSGRGGAEGRAPKII